MKLRFVWNWRQIIAHAWSFRINILLALLSGVDAAIAYVVDGRVTASLLVFGMSLTASLSRLFFQSKVSGS